MSGRIRCLRKRSRIEEIAFYRWLGDINDIIIEKLKYNIDDLPDQLYRDNFDKKMPPRDMANIIIKEFNIEWNFINSI
jgi:hypothetical protein